MISNQNQNQNQMFRVVAITMVSVAVLLFAFYLMGGDSSGFSLQQFVGIVVAAAISGVITLLLLKGQSETQKEMLQQQRMGEAEKDKDVRIYSNKIDAFSRFNKAVWTESLDDDEKAVQTIGSIRTQLYSNVILYLDAAEVNEIARAIPSGKTNNFPVILSSIIGVLNRNAEKTISDAEVAPGKAEDYTAACQALWNRFNEWMGAYVQSDVDEGTPAEIPLRSLGRQAWHFSEYDTTQLEKLKGGFNELSLIEYQEYWRTSLVRQVQRGDVVFLFRGAKKYSGVFVAKGWRVFEYDADRNVTETTSDGISPVLPVGQVNSIRDEKIQAILRQYDFYESFADDTSTSCANVVVDTVSFIPDGVDNPNTTYRKTISRYYEGYAVALLEKFREVDSSNAGRIDALFLGESSADVK